MPIYEYLMEDGSVEELVTTYIPEEGPPREIERGGQTGKLTFSVPGRVALANPSMSRLAEQGIVPYEAGMDKDAKRAKQYQKDKRAKQRTKIIEDSIREVRSATVTSAA